MMHQRHGVDAPLPEGEPGHVAAGFRDRADLDAVILHAIGGRVVVGPAQEKMAFIVHGGVLLGVALFIPMVALKREIQKGGNNGDDCSREKQKNHNEDLS